MTSFTFVDSGWVAEERAAAWKGASEKSGVHDESVSIGLAEGDDPIVARESRWNGIMKWGNV